MPRVFLPQLSRSSDKVDVRGDTAHYLNSVLRVKKGQSLVVFNDQGMQYEAEVLSVSRGMVELAIGASLGCLQQPRGGVVLVQGMLKGPKMDMVVQKTVELGVAVIQPVTTERTVLKETRKLDRWRKVALEAARQCGRPTPPPVEAPVDMNRYLESSDLRGGIVFYEGPSASPLEPQDVAVDGSRLMHCFIGPEGGFSPAEVEAMSSAGLKVRSLGGNILRAETASIAAITLIQFLMRRLT